MSDEDTRDRKSFHVFRIIAFSLVWIFFCPWLLWCFGALWFDFPASSWGPGVAIGYLLFTIALAIGLGGRWLALLCTITVAACITAGWLQIPPLQFRNWKTEVAILPRAEINGDEVSIHHFRNFDYRTNENFEPRYETKTVRLSELQGVDLFLNYWGSKMMAHPIASFDFGPDGRVCFSVETRPERGESYSALRGLYRGFELICVVADERDVVRLRSNYRKGEDVYLYHLDTGQAETAFLEYLSLINGLHQKPQWYNAVTKNCTTSLRAHRHQEDRAQWDWRMLVNGYFDELLYERGKIDQSLPFSELKKQAWINRRAIEADQDPEFSERIRIGLPKPK